QFRERVDATQTTPPEPPDVPRDPGEDLLPRGADSAGLPHLRQVAEEASLAAQVPPDARPQVRDAIQVPRRVLHQEIREAGRVTDPRDEGDAGPLCTIVEGEHVLDGLTVRADVYAIHACFNRRAGHGQRHAE